MSLHVLTLFTLFPSENSGYKGLGTQPPERCPLGARTQGPGLTSSGWGDFQETSWVVYVKQLLFVVQVEQSDVHEDQGVPRGQLCPLPFSLNRHTCKQPHDYRESPTSGGLAEIKGLSLSLPRASS